MTPLAAGAPTHAPIDLRAANLETLAHVYQDLHSHPELAMEEQRTSAIAAGHLRGAGYECTGWRDRGGQAPAPREARR